jgi:hypothetical protein
MPTHATESPSPAVDTTDSEETKAVRRQLAVERKELAAALDDLRQSADLTAKVRSKLPLIIVAAYAAGFVLAGGVGATARLLFRRGREGRTAARFGRFRLVERR